MSINHDSNKNNESFDLPKLSKNVSSGVRIMKKGGSISHRNKIFTVKRPQSN
jgi:hypothetical protein